PLPAAVRLDPRAPHRLQLARGWHIGRCHPEPRRTRMDRIPRLVAIALTLLVPAVGRADVLYTYNATPNTASVASDLNPNAKVLLSNLPPNNAAGSTDIVLTNLTTAANSPSPSTFTARPWTINLLITDTASGQWANLTFTGTFSGKLSTLSAKIAN